MLDCGNTHLFQIGCGRITFERPRTVFFVERSDIPVLMGFFCLLRMSLISSSSLEDGGPEVRVEVTSVVSVPLALASRRT